MLWLLKPPRSSCQSVPASFIGVEAFCVAAFTSASSGAVAPVV
jgi:hypothetical protein